jgi:hypothetical protein
MYNPIDATFGRSISDGNFESICNAEQQLLRVVVSYRLHDNDNIRADINNDNGNIIFSTTVRLHSMAKRVDGET